MAGKADPFLRQPNELLVLAFNHANVAMACFAGDGSFVLANPAFMKLFGFASNQRNMPPLAAFAPTENTSAAAVQFERFRAGKIRNFSAECHCAGRQGATHPVKMTGSVIDAAPGSPARFLVQFNDISGQEAAEAALTYNEARWQNALEASGQGVWDHDIRKDHMYYSRQWRRMRGLADDAEVDGAQEVWLARLHPEDRARIRAVVNRQDSGEDGYESLVYRELHPDGHYMWIWSRGRPIEWDKDGNPIRTVGTDTDITHLKEVENQIETEKERLRVTLQSIGEGVITTDAQTQIIFMNEMAQQITGWDKQEALGRPIDDVLKSGSKDGPSPVSTLVAACLDAGEVRRLDTYSELERKGGGLLFVRATAAPVRSRDDKVLGAVMVVQDATHQHKLEYELAYQATHDNLTELPNRAAFEVELRNSIAIAAPQKTAHALCLIDLDHFKTVNDGAGHAAGDQLLKDIAAVLKKNCRKTDFCARIGGDEFVVILNDCDMRSARKIADKIAKDIWHIKFRWQGQEFRVGASIGIASITSELADADELFKLADAACYAAKRNGRNCVVVAG